jgi:multiple sugar transport system substrate-binding protein
MVIRGSERFLSVMILATVLAAPAFAEERAKKLKVAWWGSQVRHERTIRVLQMFEAENPGITIDYEYGSFNDYWTRLTTLAAGNNLPDVMQQDYQYLTEWVRAGLLVPLDELTAKGILDFSDVSDSALDGGRTEGKLYGVSLGVNSTCIALDAAAFAKAGVNLPRENWTWADFERISLELTRRLGIPAVPMEPRSGIRNPRMPFLRDSLKWLRGWSRPAR